MDSNSGLIISPKNTCYCKGFIVIFTKEYVNTFHLQESTIANLCNVIWILVIGKNQGPSSIKQLY